VTHTLFVGWRSRVYWLLVGALALALVGGTAPGALPARAARSLTAPMVSIMVNSHADTQANDGVCTLREAILNANADNQSGSTDCAAGSGADTIAFNLAYPDTITLGSQLPTITSTLAIEGPGANKLTISGNNAVRILAVNGGANLTVSGLTFASGKAGNGAAISSYGSLSVTDCTFISNVSSSSSGAIYNDGGTAVVTGSTFQGNSASSAGGAIGNYGGTLTVVNSTFSGNSAAGAWGGGAIYSRVAVLRASGTLPDRDSRGIAATSTTAGPTGPNAGTLTVIASSFSGNTAPGGGGAIGNGGSGETGGTVTLQNNLMGGNLVGGVSVNCHNESGTLTDGGYNIEDTNTCSFSGTSLTNTDPLFVGLSNHGGGTLTIAVQRYSPAIDRIPNGASGCGTTLTVDQRGVHRPLDGNADGTAACDVGAYESDQQLGPAFVVNQTADANGVCGQLYCTLRQAILSAQTYPASGSYTLTFNLSAYPGLIVLGSPLPTITSTLTIQGPGADRLAVSGNSAVRILTVNNGASLAVSGLAFASGKAGNGAAISNYGSLSVTNCTFISNVSNSSSGAIYNEGGTAVVTGSTFQGNSANSAGGAIGNYGGTLTVVNSTFSGNSAAGSWGGGAIYNRVAVLRAAGVSSVSDSLGTAAASISRPTSPNAGALTVIASSFSGNTAPGGGGAIGNGGSGETGGTALLQNNLFGGNLVGGVSVNCHNESGTLTDGGYNIEDTNTCGFSGSSLKNTDPLFGGLSNHGGGTLTIAVQRYSPAIDRIPNGTSGCGVTQITDQRGVHRPLDGNADGAAACDVGAYESDQQLGPSFVVNQTTDATGVCGQLYCTLRQAILSAQAAPSGVPYTITLNLTYPANAILLDSQLPAITGQLIIQGPGADKVAISGRNAVRILAVNAGVTLTVQGLAFFNGSASNGGAISNDGNLNVRNCIFINNTATASSGAIYNHGGTAMVTGSTFSGNSAATGGGAIFNNGGALTVVNSSFANNSAAGPWGGGGILSSVLVLRASASLEGDSLGTAHTAVVSPASPSAVNLTVVASSFSGNTAAGGGGAIGNGGNGVAGGLATLQNNLFAGSLVGGVSVNCHTETGTLTDGGYNLEDANTCGFSGTSLTNTVPLFMGLGYYGGSTLTLAVRGDSPAIDRIPAGVNGCGTTLTTDQRGVHRPLDGNRDGIAACDVGAYEFNYRTFLPLIVNNH